MRSILSVGIVFVFLLPQTALGKAGSRWGSDTALETMLERREERREARARTRFKLPEKTEKIRMGWSIIEKPASPRRRRNVNPALLSGVVDGSIVVVNLPEGFNTEVRLLGVNAPEIIRAQENIECYALEAKNALRNVFAGTSVVLEQDKRYAKDSYKRLVRYVRSGSQDIGAWMIWSGYAFADRDIAHLRSQEYFLLEADAENHERGLWGYACDYNDDLRELDVLE